LRIVQAGPSSGSCDSRAGALIPGIGQEGQVLQVRAAFGQDELAVVLPGDQAVPEAAEQAAEQVALGGGVPVAGVFAAVAAGAGAG
jgi:hypothetical protein